MIYYPLSTLMLAGIRDVLVITTPADAHQFRELLGDGSQFGIRLDYAVQESPDGLAPGFIIGEQHIGDGPVALVLGNNIFYGPGFGTQLADFHEDSGASIFGYWVKDPGAYGVVEFDRAGKAILLEEKPEKPKSNYAVAALYFYDNTVIERARCLSPLAAWRAGDHRHQPPVPGRRVAAGQRAGTRHRVVGHRDL